MEQEIHIPKVQAFADALKPIADMMKKFRDAMLSLTDYHAPDIQPSILYALHGHPYGKHTRGKKRWLREMKARHRQ